MPERMQDNRRTQVVRSLTLGAAALSGLYLASLHHYLLFHSLAELFSIVVAAGIFILAWNSRRLVSDGCFLFLGIAYLYVGGLDLVHTLGYSGMGVLPGYGPNMPTQLWVAARFVESVSLLVAPFYLRRTLRAWPVFWTFFAVTVLLLAAVFTGLFPDCYVEGAGLTPFKVGSEYVIILLLLGALAVLGRNRTRFEPRVFRLLAASIIVTVGAEVAFTFYASVDDFWNLIGHYFKLVSFYLIYSALIETGLKQPYLLLFRDIKQSEARYRSLFDNMLDGFALNRIILDEAGKPVDFVFLEANDAFERLTGLKRRDIIGRRVTEAIPGVERDPADWIGRFGNVAVSGKGARFEQYAEPLDRWYAVSAYSPAPEQFAVIFENITERKRADEKLRLNEARLDALYQLNRMTDANVEELSQFVLEQAVSLTRSKIGFLGSVSEEADTVTIHAWSEQTMKDCAVTDGPIHFPIEEAGIWAEAVRQRRPYVVNDYAEANKLKRGLPDGHVKLTRVLSVPVFDNGDVVAVAAVANKEGNYAESDATQLTLLMSGLWDHVRRRRMDEALQQSVHEKDMLVKEIHHRMKNNLLVVTSLLRLQSSQLEDEGAKEFFRVTQNRVRSMSMIHERLYDSSDLKSIEFGEYVESLAASLFNAYGLSRDRVKLITDVSGATLDIDTVIPLGLIVNELISNALKHGFPDDRAGEVRLSFGREADGSCVLSVRDTGVGLPPGTDVTQSSSMGMQLVTSLTKQLRGSLTVTSSGDTAFTITFRDLGRRD